MKFCALLHFGENAASWLEKNYRLINEDTFSLCRDFQVKAINVEFQSAALDVRLMVKVKEARQFCNLAEWHSRFRHSFEVFRRLPFENP